ncbi:MAG: hypothetical protein LBC53_00115 [Spirochaetaceae bacterium]|jgi:DNA-directed RNA polymerase sigma subunit (sigma70/sigma32)|nr:hypothetical protein [Spirochaetaceae bacterium]
MSRKRKQFMLTSDTFSLDALAEEDESYFAGASASVEDEVFKNLCIKEIHEGLAALPAAQQEVLNMIFGLNGRENHSLQEVAWHFGKNCSWAFITTRQALRRLRSECGNRLEGFLGPVA